MWRLQELEYKDAIIVYINFGGLGIATRDKIYDLIDRSKELISSKKPHSVLIVTDVSLTSFDQEITKKFMEFAKYNTPYAKASALVGATGIEIVILKAISKFTERKFYEAKSLDDAKEWLLNQ